MNAWTFMIVLLGICGSYSCQVQPEGTVVDELEIPSEVDFNMHIKPILSDRCFACHGPDHGAREADLRLDLRDGIFKLLDTVEQSHVVMPYNLAQSDLWQRISSEDPQYQMPPPESNLTLSDYELRLIERWISQGGAWKPHWSFIKPKRPSVPQVGRSEWPINEIDHFILRQLETMHRHPSSKAEKEKLVRRLCFDLTGLPPSPSLIDSYLSDSSDRAYEQLIDRLLTSSAFGERMATEWIDLARYAETNGYHHDFERNMWPWRDWIIDAFNSNMPYDQFVTWQLAGDLLPDATYEQRLATAFNRNHRTTQECGSIDEEFRVSYVVDRTNTFGTAFLGLTLECAQCHDHKYDPISQKEYYQLSAFFNQVPEKGVTRSFQGQPHPQLVLSDSVVSSLENYVQHKLRAEQKHGNMQDPDGTYLDNWLEELDALSEPVMVMEDLDTLRPTFILDRGMYNRTTEPVGATTPALLSPFNPDLPTNRLGLARWLFDPQHPLTARVVANRYWQMIFGTGLVSTPEDFGNQGSLPSHPELLDWLACYLIDSGWNLKSLIKLLVMSATYQQSAAVTTEELSWDPGNRWLSRSPQTRLTAEMLRDQALMLSGLLTDQIGGPSVKPYQPSGLWEQISSGGRYRRKYMQDHGKSLYRRSLYTYWKRMQPPPAMVIFDAANRNQCTVKRQHTNTPLQALVTLNDPTYNEAARVFAERALREAGDNPKQQVSYLFRWATSRLPDRTESEILAKLYAHEWQEFKSNPDRAEQFLTFGEYDLDHNLDPVAVAALGVVANTIMNLSESMQKN